MLVLQSWNKGEVFMLYSMATVCTVYFNVYFAGVSLEVSHIFAHKQNTENIVPNLRR